MISRRIPGTGKSAAGRPERGGPQRRAAHQASGRAPRRSLGVGLAVRTLRLTLGIAGGLATSAPLAAQQPLPTDPSAAPSSTSPSPGTLRVTGRAQRSLEVDRAIVRFSVETEATDAATATRSNAEIMRRSLEVLRAQLSDDDRVSTGDLRLSPIYGESERGVRTREIVGYRMTHDLTVTLADLAQAGTVVDLAVGAGANRLHSISFVASNPDAARLDAIREATERAEAEAQALAAALGLQLGAPAEVTVSPAASGATPVYRAMALEVASTTPVEPGTYDLEVTVGIVYHLVSFKP